MARKRKLTAPSAEDMTRIEEEFRRETSPAARPMAPIAQVAAQSAQAAAVLDGEARERAARTGAEADAFRRSRDAGLLIQEIPLDQILAEDLTRDRLILDPEEMSELQQSIATNGLRLPIELYQMADEGGSQRYGLLSGYRRFKATEALHLLSGGLRFATIKALVRDRIPAPDALAAMVEENEIRADLSHFERGRIAALSVRQRVFGSTEEAVNHLFPAASKAKRSKIRSFALIFDDLGDLLEFPESLTEKQGLRLAGALRAGEETALRQTLAQARPGDATEEWAVLLPILDRSEETSRDPSRGGRPTKSPVTRVVDGGSVTTSSGFTIRREEDSRGYLIRIGGRRVDAEMIDIIIGEVQRLLEKPG